MIEGMTVSELKNILEVLEERELGDAVIAVATQPNYPLEHCITDVVARDDIEIGEDDDEQNMIWITTDGHFSGRSGYAPRGVFNDSDQFESVTL